MKKLTAKQRTQRTFSLILTVCISTLLFKECWNYIVPELFGLSELTYWKAFVFSYLLRLFGSYITDPYIDKKILKG